MELRARTRLPQVRRVAMMVPLVALLAPATAGAKTYRPTITSISPRVLNVGDRLTVHGKYFRRGRHKDSVVFQRTGRRAIFVKADLATKRVLFLTVPKAVGKALAFRNGAAAPTRFHLRVMTSRLGRQYTAGRLSPIVGPRPTSTHPGSGTAIVPGKAAAENPNGDCDGDHILNKVDTDDDNDLLPDTTEVKYHLDPCNPDTDGDGVSDGFEFQSALDLNNDDYQHPNGTVPYPGKRPYPNPLDASDADTDFDGDSLPMAIEYRLWRYSVAHNHAPASLSHMSYSDGLKYSIYRVDANEQRVPALSATNYSLGNQFLAWAGAHGYAQVRLPDSPGTLRPLTDFDRNGTADSDLYDTHGEYLDWSTPDGYLSDDERDEDGDGLSNYFEVAGSLQGQQYFDAFYPNEPRFKINYPGTQPDDPDSDGDGVLDGADDQDHDGYPNVVEASRERITHSGFNAANDGAGDVFAGLPWYGRVQPFNPCLPSIHTATCPTYVPGGSSVWAPFEQNDVNYLVFN